MANKMLIDATHPEETRVVVVRGNRVEEFDFEAASRRQLRGNIYLAKVTRVEPSLQAAFIDYGGNRHGFLAFSEIHPDYYQIPIADRQALIDEEERAHRDAEAEADRRVNSRRRQPRRRAAERASEKLSSEPIDAESEMVSESAAAAAMGTVDESAQSVETVGEATAGFDEAPQQLHGLEQPAARYSDLQTGEFDEHAATSGRDETHYGHASSGAADATEDRDERPRDTPGDRPGDGGAVTARGRRHDRDDGDGDGDGESGDGAIDGEEEEIVKSVGGADAMEEVPDRTPRYRRQYKIQEVIKRRQIMLVQVVKEERGTKGAALTTYLSLAGRYSVLMPNTARGGGISRKITNVQDRKRLKEVAEELEVPEGMGIILRTAGAMRTKTEIKRDFEYLLRAWERVRDFTLNSSAPTLVYEEGSLVKRSIRDLYNKDIDEVVVAGDEAYRDARDFMRMLMPTHAKNVKPYRDGQPILTKYGIESQLDAMFSPIVQLRSGGYIVLNQTEALVAIDVNSGRATREHHIEDTALKTNLEASEEIARQLRLRDLAELIVIDFIDMDEKRNNRSVERRLKDCLKNDRARIQVGRISHFGLMEMSRQRIRTSVLESSTDKCPNCGGTGHVRSVASVALQLLRMVEEQLQRGATHNIIARTRSEIALYVLNQKRAHLHELEQRFHIAVTVTADPTISGQTPFIVEKGEQVHSIEQARAFAAQAAAAQASDIAVADYEAEEPEETEESIEESEAVGVEEDEAVDAVAETAEPAERPETAEAAAENGDNGDANGRRRRRRRRRGRREDEGGQEAGFRSADEESAVAGSEALGAEPRGPDLSFRDEERPDRDDAMRATESLEQQPFVQDDVTPASTQRAPEEPDLFAAETDRVEPAAASRASPLETLAEDGEGGDADGARRRRRGRRGGRRNRREDEVLLTPPETDVPPIDAEIADAVADFGGPPIEAIMTAPAAGHVPAEPLQHAVPPELSGTPQNEPAPEPAPAAEHDAAVPAKSGPSRRRSTIREPAPFVIGGATLPAPVVPATVPASAADQAAETSSAAEASPEQQAPRRAGWWAKRLLGERR